MYETEWFGGSVTNLSSGPLLALILCGPNAVRHWLEMIGPSTWKERSAQPNCLRNQYGEQGCDSNNALHGSENETEALRELHFFFPEGIFISYIIFFTKSIRTYRMIGTDNVCLLKNLAILFSSL